jgi:phosphopentomutase
MPKRVLLLVLDGCGCGEMPDASKFGDAGSNTLGNLSHTSPHGLDLPHLGELGLGNIVEIRGVPPVSRARGAFGRSAEAGPAKDTTSGHWEIAGCIQENPFPTFPDGFGADLIGPFVERAGVPGILGNKPASGTDILKELGEEHLATKKLIVYTSGDSVFQVAAHEELYPPERLYEICRIARELCDGKYRVGRIIARPFVGDSAATFKRTTNRRDFSVPPPEPTLLDRVSEAGMPVIGVGKISDIFAASGVTTSHKTKDNADGMAKTLKAFRELDRDGLIFTNLVDTDQLFGHRNDTVGFKESLEAFDEWLPDMLAELGDQDMMIITADHGIDPTTPSTDHSREYVPILVVGGSVKGGVDLGTRATFADIGRTIDEYLGVNRLTNGTSFLSKLLATADARA